MTVPATAAAGAVISVNTTVSNEGGGDAGAFTVTFFLSSNSTLDANDQTLSGSRAVSSLAAGATSSGATNLTIPGNTAVGTYYIIGKADGNDAVAETSESNNTLARSIQVGGDLVISAVTAPTTAGPGTVISVSATTKNQGTGTVAASTTRFYLSTNGQLDANDLTLDGLHAVPQLAPSATSSTTIALSIPATTTAGPYYLLAVADANNAVAETQESNNIAIRSLQIGTDLAVSALTVPARGAAGLAIAITETTLNQGAAMVGPTVTRFYLSLNASVDASDVVLAPDHAVPELSPSAAHSAAPSLTIPANTAAGAYYVIAKADALNAVTETQESNNTLARLIEIGGDLAVSVFTAPAQGSSGASLVVNDTTVNQGSGLVAPSTTRFYLSTNASLDSGDTQLSGERSVPQLGGGGTSSGATTVTIPSGIATGSYYLFAKADGANLIPESQESNNTAIRAFQIGPDLVVSSVNVPARGGAGLPIVVTDTTANHGAGPADASVVAFYLSTNGSLDASDPSFGVTRSVPPLAAGASSSGATTLTIPAGTAAGTTTSSPRSIR